MHVFYTDHFVLPLPPGHRFPMEKYALLRRRVDEARLTAPERMHEPERAAREHLALAHDAAYLDRVLRGDLTPAELRGLGFPWSEAMVERSLRSTGATIGACLAALAEGGVAVNLAGGTHHAFRDRAEGYCVFNDGAVAALAMLAEGHAARVLLVDCDVHQGDGTAAILADEPRAFTFSIHGERNYPFRKQRSDLDVALPDRTGDEGYLAALASGLAEALRRAAPDLAIYLSGADPYEGDRLGRLALTKAGLARRDRLVLEALRDRQVPTAVTMGGGYARVLADVVDIHFTTVAIAAELAGSWRAPRNPG